jgi:hypothetical protein
MKRLLFVLWAMLALALTIVAALAGYSPFGDGVQERDVYSRGGGPRHK